MIRSLYRTPEGHYRAGLRTEEFGDVLQQEEGLLWVDFQGEPPESCEPILRNTFRFHPLAIDDALQESHVPKVDDWGEYLYLVFHALNFRPQSENCLETLEVDVFLGDNYIVTHHDRPIPAIDRTWETCQRDERHLRQGADHLLYRLVDDLTTGYMAVAESLDDAIDLAEDHIFSQPTPQTLQQLFTYKRSLLRMRQVITPQREVLNKLARDDFAVVGEDDRVFFRDVYDHLVRLHDINESMRDLVGGAMDTYLSVINNRMNDIIKILTVITTLFMPLSFIVGFFGMNFFEPAVRLPAWTSQASFAIVLPLMIALPLGMYLWMRRRGWLR
ncbi:MAG: magnesium/cobalt transporter CorA [Armatimonadetes bacterium]|nr:magnesium/cobalt transporter CorA [Armatimonadota bacterium]